MARISLDALPTEVLLLIVQFCGETESLWPYEWDVRERADLQALSWVSRRIRGIALPVLYQEVGIKRSRDKIAAFLTAMRAAPYQALYIKWLALRSPVGIRDATFDVGGTFNQPNEGWLGLSLFRNLTKLHLADDMIPTSTKLLRPQNDLFPVLEECVFQSGIHEPPEAPDLIFSSSVTNFIPFWTAPRLQTFALLGEQMRLASDGNNNHYATERLSDIRELDITCCVDVDAFRALLAIRKPRSFMYEPPNLPPWDEAFDHFIQHISPHVQHLTYLWSALCENTLARYPRVSAFTSTTSMRLSAPIIADFSAEAESYEHPVLLCKLPRCLEYLEISIDPQYVHRRQLYDVVLDLVATKPTNLSLLKLQFMIAVIDPDKCYWNHRLVSEQERRRRGGTDLYGSNGQTVEHNHLRHACAQAKIDLRAAYPQMLPNGDFTEIFD